MDVNRVSVKEAAQLLDTTEHAIRQRIYRGTLHADKDEEGRVHVLISESDTVHGDGLHGDTRQDARRDTPPENQELIEELRQTNSFLRQQLEAEREANRENRRLLAAALERIPAIEAPEEPPREARDSDLTPFEQAAKGDTSPGYPGDIGDPRSSGGDKEPWWRRWFGG